MHIPTRRLIALTAVAAGVCAAMAGCSLGHPANTSTAKLNAFPLTADAADPAVYRSGGAQLLVDGNLLLPLDGYDLYAQNSDRKLLTDALTRVESRCMQAKGAALPAGFATMYLPNPMPPIAYYGVSTTAEATTYGYRLPDPTNATTPTADVPQHPTKDQDAFYGSSGCAQAAYRTLNLSQADAAFNVVQNLRSQALFSLLSDPRLKTANAQWSACMKTAGYTYPDPTAPGHDKSLLGKGLPVPPGAALPPVSPDERAAAESDVACKQKTRYLQTYTELAADHQDQLIAQNEQPLQQVMHEWNSVLASARANGQTAT